MNHAADYVTDLKALRETIGKAVSSLEAKKLRQFEKHSLFYLSHASLLAISSPAFTVPILLVSAKTSQLTIHDEHTFSVTVGSVPVQAEVKADESAHYSCGIYTLVSGFEESLRINGVITIKSSDQGQTILTISLTEHYFHCAKSIKRADFWQAQVAPVDANPLEDKALVISDGDVQAFIKSAPFLLLSTQDAEGNMDLSPRGDPDGFLRILENGKLLMPERPGNKIADSLTNLLADPRLTLILFKPGDYRTLVMAGEGRLTKSKQLLEPSAVKGKPPLLAVEIDVHACFFGLNSGLKEMDLWNRQKFLDRSLMPSLGTIVSEQLQWANKLPGGKSKLGKMFGKITGAAGDALINLDYKKLY